MKLFSLAVLCGVLTTTSGYVLAEPVVPITPAPIELPAGFRHAADHHWVSGYVDNVQQVQQLKQSGIESVISLVPLAERPEFDEAKAMHHAEIGFITIPITGAADLTLDNVRKLDAALQANAGKKTLIHCASGNRVGALMALRAAWIDGLSVSEALLVGKQYGMTRLESAVMDKLQPVQ